jgi:hypothetical protein
MADAASSESTTSKITAMGNKLLPYILIVIGFGTQLATVVLLGINAGSPDTNAEIRKYVGLSSIPIILSLIALAAGFAIYFTRYPQYVVFTAITASLFAIAIASMSLCISLIEKKLN